MRNLGEKYNERGLEEEFIKTYDDKFNMGEINQRESQEKQKLEEEAELAIKKGQEEKERAKLSIQRDNLKLKAIA